MKQRRHITERPAVVHLARHPPGRQGTTPQVTGRHEIALPAPHLERLPQAPKPEDAQCAMQPDQQKTPKSLTEANKIHWWVEDQHLRVCQVRTAQSDIWIP